MSLSRERDSGLVWLVSANVAAGTQLSLEQERSHADDAAHRRAYLMAHVRQKIALNHRRLLGRFFGETQFDIRALALNGECDVVSDGSEKLQVTLAVNAFLFVMLDCQNPDRARGRP